MKQIGGQACLFISLLNGEWIDKYDDYSNYPHQNKTYSNDLKLRVQQKNSDENQEVNF